MEDEEYEYRVPAKLLNSRDPIILNKLSFGEAGQWLVFGVGIYLSFNMLPLDFTFKLVIATIIFMCGMAFIHSPINGLAGIEWGFIYMRFNREKKLHRTKPPVESIGTRTLISIRAATPVAGDLSTYSNEEAEGEEEGRPQIYPFETEEQDEASEGSSPFLTQHYQTAQHSTTGPGKLI